VMSFMPEGAAVLAGCGRQLRVGLGPSWALDAGVGAPCQKHGLGGTGRPHGRWPAAPPAHLLGLVLGRALNIVDGQDQVEAACERGRDIQMMRCREQLSAWRELHCWPGCTRMQCE
jgi:hypothetical protein